MDRRRVLLILATLIAVMGTMLVFLYVRAADQRAEEKFDTVPILVAADQIAQGETVADAQAGGKFTTKQVAKSQLLPGAVDNFNTIGDQIAQTTIYPGEQIITAKFDTTIASGSSLAIPKGKLAIAVNLTDSARVAGFVTPGDEVAIFHTTAQGQHSTRLLLERVQVIAVGATPTLVAATDSQGRTSEQIPRTLLTVAVNQDQAQRLLFASDTGELAFGLLNKDSEVGGSTMIDAENLYK